MKKLLSSLIALLLVVGLTACGDDKEKGSAQGVTDSKIIVGNSAASSGALAPVGVPFLAGMNAYFNMVNDEGGIDGRKIEFINYDDEFLPEKGISSLERLVYDDEVFALVGHFGTPIVGATIEEIKSVGIPTVYFATGTGILYDEKAEGTERAALPVQPVYPMEGRIMATWAKGEFGAESVGVIYTSDDAGNDLLKGVEKEAKTLGLSVVSEQVAVGEADVSAAVTKILSEDTDVVIIAGIQNTFPQIVKELAKQGNKKTVLTTYVNIDPIYAEAITGDVNGQFEVYGNYWVDLNDSEDLDNYRTWIKTTSDEDLSSNAYAMTGWIAADFFVEGLRRLEGKDVTWDSYIDAMESEPVKNPFGGYIDFSDGKRTGTQEMGLIKLDASNAFGWTPVTELLTMEQILEGSN